MMSHASPCPFPRLGGVRARGRLSWLAVPCLAVVLVYFSHLAYRDYPQVYLLSCFFLANSLHFVQVMIGEDTLIRFSGCKAGEACTIVLRGARCVTRAHTLLSELLFLFFSFALNAFIFFLILPSIYLLPMRKICQGDLHVWNLKTLCCSGWKSKTW